MLVIAEHDDHAPGRDQALGDAQIHSGVASVPWEHRG